MSYETKDNMVSHPNHYQSKSGIEVIDVIEAFTEDLSGIEAVDTANAIKYILRWKKKNGIQDIEKAIWYLTHLKEHLIGEDMVSHPDSYFEEVDSGLGLKFVKDELKEMNNKLCEEIINKIKGEQ